MLSHNVCEGFCRFAVGNDGSLNVTIDPRQAIAVQTGAMGVGAPVPLTPQQVSVIFSENATTTFGEVSGGRFLARLVVSEPVALSGHDADISVGRISLWWAVCQSLVIGTRPTRCVGPLLIER
jgi:hypothetical protein